MLHQDLTSDNWVAYGTYTALSYLAQEPDSSMQGGNGELQNACYLLDLKRETKTILKIGEVHQDDLLLNMRD